MTEPGPNVEFFRGAGARRSRLRMPAAAHAGCPSRPTTTAASERSRPSSPQQRAASGTRRGPAHPAPIASAAVAESPSANGLNWHFVELDRRAPFARTGAHSVERLVPAAHRLLAFEERDAEALTALAVDQH